MSDYSSLKATINANVKANDNHEITGAIMNSVLNAMVNSLGAGYQFMGMATPSNPGTAQSPDYKCFYLATTPGTYTYLGGLVVADGEVALLKYDTSWTKEVTGAATADLVNQLVQKVGTISGDEALFKNIGYIQHSDGVFVPANDWRTTDMIPCKAGELLYVSIPTTNSATWRVSFYNANGDFLSGESDNGYLTIPSSVAYFRATGAANEDNHIFKALQYAYDMGVKISELSENKADNEPLLFNAASNDLFSKLNIIKIPISSPLFEEYLDGKYINPNGTISSLDSYKIIRYPINYDIRIINVKVLSGGQIRGAVEYVNGQFEDCGQNINELGTNNVFGTPLASKPKYLYLNINKTDPSTAAEYVQFVLAQPLKFYADTSIQQILSVDSLIIKDKFVGFNGEYGNLAGCAVYKIPVDSYNFNYKLVNAQSVAGAFFDGTGNFVGRTYGTDTENYQIPVGAKYLYLNAQYNTEVYAIPKTIKNKNYCSVIGEKIDFNNKSIVFFGDSITAGVGATDESKRWVNVFSQKLIDNNGLSSFRNLGSSGATFVSGQVGRAQIEALIQSATISEDIIIIAAGTNDYGVNIPIGTSSDTITTTFYGALNSLVSYLAQNYSNKTIIFVLPCGRFLTGNYNDMDAYREIIFVTAIKNGFGVIDGSQFGLPCNSDVMPDGLHPNDIGHSLYANRMYDFLGR